MNEYNPNIKPGFLEVFCGPMKSGKTLALIYRVEKLKYMMNSKYKIFKPALDVRNNNVHSRFNKLEENCVFIDENNPLLILENIEDEELVAIDEAQFFSEEIIKVIDTLLQKDINVVVAGLDLDFRKEPFGFMPQILAMANEVHKLNAVCDHKNCSNLAYYTYRTVNGKPASYDSPTILIGDVEEGYEARCRKHHFIEKKQ